ncbi:hypothetical protein Taro_030818 [Colocasia esculenta]|uniref:Uncharacterized protein n=1 Tax=Colocasia esculenta TaxID=4460 RepID=A0A843VHB2_COLES|nr:hypothetical protein [Colocasia esculenta]
MFPEICLVRLPLLLQCRWKCMGSAHPPQSQRAPYGLLVLRVPQTPLLHRRQITPLWVVEHGRHVPYKLQIQSAPKWKLDLRSAQCRYVQGEVLHRESTEVEAPCTPHLLVRRPTHNFIGEFGRPANKA